MTTLSEMRALVEPYMHQQRINLADGQICVAVITDVRIGKSKAGRTMATVEFNLIQEGRKVSGYYVLDHAVGLDKFTRLMETHCPDMLDAPVDTAARALIGRSVTVKLRAYQNGNGGTSFSADVTK